MKKIIMLAILLTPILLNAQGTITFQYFYTGYGKYAEVKNNTKKMIWQIGPGNAEIDFSQNIIKIGTRELKIFEKKEIFEGYIFRCFDSDFKECKVSYTNSDNGSVKIISFLQNGMISSYSNKNINSD